MAKSNTELLTKIEAATAPATTNGSGKPLTVADQVKVAIDRMKSQMALALPKHMNPDRMARIALTTIRTNPKLLECSVESLLAALMQASQLGLEPGLLGQCYFVPFRNNKTGRSEVQFIAGYKGLLDLARRSGKIKTIQAIPVYSNDKFNFSYGWDSTLDHVPAFKDRGEIAGFYAYAITLDGGQYFEFMTKEDVDAIRARSKAKDYGPWVTDYVQMGRKTVLRRLCNYLPLSIEQATSMATITEHEEGEKPAIEINLGDDAPVAIEPDWEKIKEESIAREKELNGDEVMEIEFSR